MAEQTVLFRDRPMVVVGAPVGVGDPAREATLSTSFGDSYNLLADSTGKIL